MTAKDRRTMEIGVVGVPLLLLGLGLGAKALWGEVGLWIALVLGLIPLLGMQLRILIRIEQEAKKRRIDDVQLQALASLHSTLQPRAPLPILRDWALSPDIALEHIRQIDRLEAQSVLELGSGVSTLLAGLRLRQAGRGRVVALDHDASWADRTREYLALHGLEQDRAEVRHAPLIELEGGARWYDSSALQGIEGIDLLLIDGPPDTGDSGNRLPALEQLGPRLASRCAVLVDDAARPAWRAQVLAWAREAGFKVEAPKLNDSGALYLTRDA